jgi:hypothetical protein
MKSNLFGGLVHVLCVASVCLHTAAQEPSGQPPNHFKPIRPDDPKGLGLPPGVPRTVDISGSVIGISHQFTTREYRQAAVKLVLQEANRVAEELHLQEHLPIVESNLKELFSCSQKLIKCCSKSPQFMKRKRTMYASLRSCRSVALADGVTAP